MKRSLFILFLGLQLSVLSVAQTNTNHWLTIEQSNYELCNLSLNILHHPSLANDIWLSIQIENKDSISQRILASNLEVKVRAYDKDSNDLLQEGMFTSSDPSELLDNFGQNPLEVPKLAPGIHTISDYISSRSSSILAIPSSGFIRTEMSIRFSLELNGSERILLEWDDLEFEFDWHKPNTQQINQIKDKLNTFLLEPQYNTNNSFVLKMLLDQNILTTDLTKTTLINSLKKYESYPNQKRPILQYINKTFGSSQAIKDYYKDKIKQRNIHSLNDLKELPTLWDNEYIKLLSDWLKVAPLNVQVRIYDMLFLRQKQWIKNKAFCSYLSNILLEQYGEILYQLPEELTDGQLRTWGSLATALGKSGDVSAIGIICPFLKSKKNLWGREMVLFTESLEAPRPTRVCDIALEAILNLQNKNKKWLYEKNGFSPPYIHGEAEVIIEKVRSNLIKELTNSSICQYISR